MPISQGRQMRQGFGYLLAGFGAVLRNMRVLRLAILPFTILWLRAAWFLSPQRPAMQVKTIGFLELGFGIFLVVMLAIGYAL